MYGDIVDMVIVNKRYGLVTYRTDKEADEALDAMDKQMLDGFSLRVNRATEAQARRKSR